MTAALMIMSFALMGTQSRSYHECWISFWSAFLLCCFCVGGTMIMRKFHNSIAVGFFMGVTVASCQFFISLSFIYWNYRHEQRIIGMNAKEETLLACMSAVQAILLGSFAAILAAHRTEILDKPPDSSSSLESSDVENRNTGIGSSSINQQPPGQGEALYQPPTSTAHVTRT
jgi:hypothetical protein